MAITGCRGRRILSDCWQRWRNSDALVAVPPGAKMSRMSDTAAGETQTAAALHGEAILQEIRASGISYVLMLPDVHTSSGLIHPLRQSGNPPIIRLAREDEGIG